MGQAGQRTCRWGTQVSNGAPRPAASLAAQPTRPRRGISEGPDSLRLRLRQSPSPDRRSGPEVVVPVRAVGQRLPPARAQPRGQPPPSRSEGDKGPGWALLYLRNQREQRLLHRARFDLESRVQGEAGRPRALHCAGATDASGARRGGHGPPQVAQPRRQATAGPPPASQPACSAMHPRLPWPRPQPGPPPG